MKERGRKERGRKKREGVRGQGGRQGGREEGVHVHALICLLSDSPAKQHDCAFFGSPLRILYYDHT